MPTSRDLRVASSRGVSLYVHDLGGTGEPLLLCHATGFCGGAYGRVAAALTDQFHVWALDFRGHGRSDAPVDDDYSWARMAEDVRSVQQVLQPGGISVLGHSMGGGAALLAEATWPGTVRRGYLYEPAVLASSGHGAIVAALTEQTLRRTAAFASRADATAHLGSRLPYARWRPDCLSDYVEHGLRDLPDGSAALRCEPAHEALCYSSGSTCLDSLRGVRIPLALGAGGARDLFGAALDTAALSRALPGSVLVEHPGLGHFGPFEAPEVIAESACAALLPGSVARNGR